MRTSSTRPFKLHVNASLPAESKKTTRRKEEPMVEEISYFSELQAI